MKAIWSVSFKKYKVTLTIGGIPPCILILSCTIIEFTHFYSLYAYSILYNYSVPQSNLMYLNLPCFNSIYFDLPKFTLIYLNSFDLGVIQQPRGQDFDHFWPPTHLTWTSMDISLTTYLCPRGHFLNPHPFLRFFFQSNINWKKNCKLCAVVGNMHFFQFKTKCFFKTKLPIFSKTLHNCWISS